MPVKRRTFVKGAAALSAIGLSSLRPLKAQTKELLSKAIPKSGEAIPVIGIGTNRYGVGQSESERAPLRNTLKRFHQLGGRLIDTAPMYGSSESVLGDLTAELGVNKDLFIATKSHSKNRDDILESMEQSFIRLQRQKIDLMQVHSLINWKEQLPLMRELKQAGRVRYIGISTSRVGQHEELAEIMRKHELDFIQVNYSLADRNAEKTLLPLAFEKGIAVMVNLPLGRGKLFKVVGDRQVPIWAKAEGCETWAQFFLKYVVSHPIVTCAIPGTRKEHHLVDNMNVAMQHFADAKFRKRQEVFYSSL